MQLVYAPAALADLDLIEEYIAESNVESALRIGDSLRRCCKLLSENPELGPARADLLPGLRFFPHSESNYLIFYGIRGDSVEIVRVLHGSLDYIKQFG